MTAVSTTPLRAHGRRLDALPRTTSKTSTPATTTPPRRDLPAPPRAPDRPRFVLPEGRSATAPPEAEGRRRDEVGLVVASPDGVQLTSFRALPDHLRAGDLLVVNTSATLPAAIDAVRASSDAVVVHAAGPHPDGEDTWVVEVRRSDRSGPVTDVAAGEALALAGGMTLDLLAPHPDPAPRPGPETRSGTEAAHTGAADRGDPAAPAASRLWRARLRAGGSVERELHVHGRPIAYGYVEGRFALADYQTVFARRPGSAEMPSAGRPFTAELVTELVSRGIGVAPIELHTGVSSLEAGEPPEPERFHVPQATARLVDHTRRTGGRVVAVGTTVTRALETVARDDGTVRGGSGWTDLVLGPHRTARVVGGLLTGWHEPEASHLALLDAVAGAPLVARAYDAALAHSLRWHEFGDSCLLLP